jgi:L-asparaginase II
MRSTVLVEVIRGGAVEARHRGAVAIVDFDGNDAAGVGSTNEPVFIRSAVKPFVSALLVSSGAADALGITAGELAVAASSHGGTDEAATAVHSLLARAGRTEDDLRNGTGGPTDAETGRRLELDRSGPGPVRQMCSGEHAAMLALATHCGWPIDGYYEAEHPVQRAIGELVGRVFGIDPKGDLAIDDCAVPTWRVPLGAIARAYAWFARPDRLPAELGDLAEPFARVREAMTENADRIGGPGEFDGDLTGADGAFVAKEGAEGLLAVGSLARGLGLAMSIEDGDKTRRATPVVALAALADLRLLDEATAGWLRERHWQPIVDSVGRSVGELRPAFRLVPGE